MLSDNDCRKIAVFICEAMKEDIELQQVIADAMKKVVKPKRCLIRLSEAAIILGISKSQLYKIKDDEQGNKRFSYVKQGSSKSCPVLFDSSRLVQEYERYLLEK